MKLISLSSMKILYLAPLIPTVVIALLILNRKSNQKHKFIVALTISLLAIAIGIASIWSLGSRIYLVGIVQIVLYVIICSIASCLVTFGFVLCFQPKDAPTADNSNTENGLSAAPSIINTNQSYVETSNPYMSRYSEKNIKTYKDSSGNMFCSKELVSEDESIVIKKDLFFGSYSSIAYVLPISNDYKFYFNFIKSFNSFSGINIENTTPSVYENEDELSSYNYIIDFSIGSDNIQLYTRGLEQRIILYIQGKDIVTNERNYDNLVIMSFEDVLKKSK